MIPHEQDREWRAWVIAGDERQTVRFEAPIEPEENRERPWVELRSLTLREALRRDSISMSEEYELAADGRPVSMRRRYDFEAATGFDLEHCLVDMMLPVEGETLSPDCAADELLDRAGPRLAEWLLECIEAVNMRRPEDRAVLTAAKKSLRAAAQGGPGWRRSATMPCVPRDAGGGLLREGRDFSSTAELVAKLPERPSEWLRPGLGEELAAATLRELMWLELGGAPRWDEQAAWRVELWEEFLVEQQRPMLAASSFEGL